MKSSSVSYNFIVAQNRLDGGFHLSDGLEVRKLISRSPYSVVTIKDVTSNIYCPGIFRRNYVDSGVPFLGGGDIQKQDLDSGKYLRKENTPNYEILKIEKGWTLVTCGGTIGDTVFANNLLAKCWVSQHVMRVIPKGIREGMLYAYLASKYGKMLLTTNTYGSVIPTLNSEAIGNLPIPIFPDEYQSEIDSLIQESATLREEALDELDTAHKIIESEINSQIKSDKKIVNIKSIINSHNKRFEAFYHTSKNRQIYDLIIEQFEYKTLGSVTSKIFRPGIFKREYVKNGVTFLGGADIMMAIPRSDKKLSFRQLERIPELKVDRGWILVTCGGTIGNTVCVDKQIAKCAVSQHVMRIVPSDNILSGYLYAFLSSKIGHSLITLFSTGSVIPQVEAHHLERIPIPIFEDSKMQEIEKLVESYISKIESSKYKESYAISLVENTISNWQKTQI